MRSGELHEAKLDPTLIKLIERMDGLRDQGVTYLTAQATSEIEVMVASFPPHARHRISLRDGMGSTSVSFEPPVEHEFEDGSKYVSYDVVFLDDIDRLIRDAPTPQLRALLTKAQHVLGLAEQCHALFDRDMDEIVRG